MTSEPLPRLPQEKGYCWNRAFSHGHRPKCPQTLQDMEQELYRSEEGLSVDENKMYSQMFFVCTSNSCIWKNK